MITDGHRLDRDARIRADVAVVGAGPAGLTVAEALAQAGRRVVVIEAAGRHHGRADNDGLRGTSSGAPFPLVASRHRGFGGTSTHWTRETGLRLRGYDDVDLAPSSFRPADGWPFSGEVLKRYYGRAYASFGLPSDEPPRPDTPLAWTDGPELAMFSFAPHSTFTARYDAFATSRRVEVVLAAAARRIEVASPSGAVTHLEMATRDGNRFTVEASAYVMACGGIDNARMLLASPGLTGRGVGNEHDNVGRYFMDHLSVDTGILVPFPGVDLSVPRFRDRVDGGVRTQPMLWLNGETLQRHALPNAAYWIDELDPLYVSSGVSALRSLLAATRYAPRHGLGVHGRRALLGGLDAARFVTRRALRRPPRQPVFAMRILSEQVPDRESRIGLSPDRDGFGIPRVDLRWKINDADLNGIVEHQRVLGDLLEQRGVARLVARYVPATHRSPLMANYHHIGATRMHPEPRHGVVDDEGRVHSAPNLFVVGSSVFPTGGYVNPTLTIVAMALRAAEAIERQLGRISAGEAS